MYYSISVYLPLLEVHEEAARLSVIAKRQECSSALRGEIGRYTFISTISSNGGFLVCFIRFSLSTYVNVRTLCKLLWTN